MYEGTTAVEPPATPEAGYHFTEDMAIAWVRQQQALVADKPFFMYFAPGATHAPHHVPKEWRERYRGRFDAGWDALRDERSSLVRRRSASFLRTRSSPRVPPRSRHGTTYPAS